MADLEAGQRTSGDLQNSQLPLLAPPVFHAQTGRLPTAAASAMPVGQQATVPHSAAEPQPWTDALGGLVDQPISIPEAMMTMTTTAVRLRALDAASQSWNRLLAAQTPSASCRAAHFAQAHALENCRTVPLCRKHRISPRGTARPSMERGWAGHLAGAEREALGGALRRAGRRAGHARAKRGGAAAAAVRAGARACGVLRVRRICAPVLQGEHWPWRICSLACVAFCGNDVWTRAFAHLRMAKVGRCLSEPHSHLRSKSSLDRSSLHCMCSGVLTHHRPNLQ